jgi:DNA mismatch repair protein MutH
VTIDQLLERAHALAGFTVEELAQTAGARSPTLGVHGKGRMGELFERLLGATGGSGQRMLDFPEIGVELKTIPLDTTGQPQESTFVCAVDLEEDVDYAESWVARKLRRVLFVPLVGPRRSPASGRRVGLPVLFEPTEEEDAVFAADYADIMGLVGIGRVEEVSARLGHYLQLRPKARDGSARVTLRGREGEPISVVPRGFYLRASFTREALTRRAR